MFFRMSGDLDGDAVCDGDLDGDGNLSSKFGGFLHSSRPIIITSH